MRPDSSSQPFTASASTSPSTVPRDNKPTSPQTRRRSTPSSNINAPISFFMKPAAEIEATPGPGSKTLAPQSAAPTSTLPGSGCKGHDEEYVKNERESAHDSARSKFGVQSLADAVSAAYQMDRHDDDLLASSTLSGMLEHSLSKPDGNTPAFAHSPLNGSDFGEASTPKSTSLRSFRLEDDDDDDYNDDDVDDDDDDSRSQAVFSSGDEERHEDLDDRDRAAEHVAAQAQKDDVVPELVMPSVTMPKRRPFTEAGRQLGKLKVMVVGPKGHGKTSLIKSIVQNCEHIVHVDPSPTTETSMSVLQRHPSQPKRATTHKPQTSGFVEVYASTRAYPAWWSELEEDGLLKRRKSFNDTVLERNVCFVDTPAYDECENGFEKVLHHVEASLHRNASLSCLKDGEVMSLLAGNGGVQIDAVLCLLRRDPTPKELDFLKRLSSITNVLPLIGKADLLSHDQTTALKRRHLKSFQSANIKPFLFGKSLRELISSSECGMPYSISSAPSLLDENMDASLLMSADYAPPLRPSDLQDLTSKLLHPDNASWLRHSAAKKFVLWRRAASFQPPSMSMNTLHQSHQHYAESQRQHFQSTSSAYTSSSVHASSLSPSAVLVTNDHDVSSSSAPSYTLARLADHTQREERLVQVRLARWASDLQRALRNERERFAALRDTERKRWLHERMDEIVSPDSLDGEKALMPLAAIRWRGGAQTLLVDARDPLGLLALDERLRGRLGRAVTILGGVGVVGAVVMWCGRSLEWDWCQWWGGHDGGILTS